MLKKYRLQKKLFILIFAFLTIHAFNIFAEDSGNDSVSLNSETTELAQPTERVEPTEQTTTRQPLITMPTETTNASTASSMPNYQNVFNMANRYYSEGKKDEALETYMNMLASHVSSAMIYYNIGNIYAEQDEYSKAIAYYEKALRLSGYDEALQNNLRYAYKNVGGDEFYDAYNVKHFHLFYYINKISIILILLSATKLFVIVLFVYILKIKIKIKFLANKNEQYMKKVFIIFSTVFVFSFVAYLFSNHVTTSDFLIIQNNEAYIREGASENSKNMYNLSNGEKVAIIEAHENWYYVKVRSGGRGWIKASDGISVGSL